MSVFEPVSFLDLEELYSGTDDYPVGCTEYYGMPDLAEGASCPVSLDCQAVSYDDGIGVRTYDDPTASCGFQLQIDLSDIQSLQASRFSSSDGLLSFY